MKRVLSIAAASVLLVAGCTTQRELPEERVDLGTFRLGHNVVVADNAQKVPPSRNAEAEEWEEAIKTEVERRFGAYEGEGLFHLGVLVEGYTLAIPGIPIVLSPKSALIVSVNIFDNAQADNGRNGRLTEEAKQIVVLESVSANTVFGSGLTQSKDKQMQNLAFNVARLIENWMVENQDEWFVPLPALEETSAEIAANGELDAAEVN